MADLILRNILKEYEQKKFLSEKKHSEKISLFYNNHQDLYNLNEEINNIALQISKSILSNNQELTRNLKLKFSELNKKKNFLIDSLNLPNNFFIPDYECALCKDTGYLLDNNKSVLCNCLKQKIFDIKYNSSNIGDVEKENFSNFNINVYSDEINKEQYKATISPRKNIENIKRIANNFIDNFEDENQKNLLFIGNTGLGKTFLSNCIAYELLKKGKTILYQSSNTMLDSIIDYKFSKENNSDNIYDNILNTDLLIIDDLGTENINSLKFAELFNIINTRLLNQNKKITKTIISTNLSIDNLFKNYDERIVSRLVGYYDICRFFGDDIRFKKH